MSGKAPPPPGFVTEENSSSSAPPITTNPVPNAPYPTTGNAYPEAPPSYQNAMSYPATLPPYPGNPHPNGNQYTAHPGVYVPNITVTTLPQPPPQAIPHAHPRVVVQVAHGPTCSHCGSIMTRESDVCCILCLILLTIFTFPVGLFFLCCLPCAVQMRCQGCGRST